MSESPVQNIRWDGQVAIVELQGDIDLHRSSVLQETLMDLLDKHPSRVVIDLGEVPYMDSSGVASLVKLLSRCRTAKCELVLANPASKVRSIFEITRLDSVFDIRSNVEDALSEA